MNHEAISQVFFDERRDAPSGPLFRECSEHAMIAGGDIDAIATGYVVSLLESICARELERLVDADEEAVVGKLFVCRHCAPVAIGGRMRLTGWVERIGERSTTFRVQAQDDHERVCEGRIAFDIVPRARIASAMSRKRAAIARRELFAPA